jgi:hypothetical protein
MDGDLNSPQGFKDSHHEDHELFKADEDATERQKNERAQFTTTCHYLDGATEPTSIWLSAMIAKRKLERPAPRRMALLRYNMSPMIRFHVLW